MDNQIPNIDPNEIILFIKENFPKVQVEYSEINPDYKSWNIIIKNQDNEIDIFWGPQSGFGGTSVKDLPDEVFGFEAFDKPFNSLKDCLDFLNEKLSD